MKKLLYTSILLLGFPIGIMCILSLPLIKLGIVQPDPNPWNWFTVYVIDFVFGLTLLTQLAGFLKKASWGRPLTLIVAGYSVFAFSQTALETVLDLTGTQDAPIAQPAFILTFMLMGLTLGATMIIFALLYPDHWQASTLNPSKKDLP
jgi:hypothetical protein